MESSEKLEELDQSRLSKASDTTRKVSYAVLDVSPKNTTDVLEKFAKAAARPKAAIIAKTTKALLYSILILQM
jgi:hypothetical protein